MFARRVGGIELETLDAKCSSVSYKRGGSRSPSRCMNDERERRPRRRAESSKNITHRMRNESQTYMKERRRKRREKILEKMQKMIYNCIVIFYGFKLDLSS